MPDEASSAKAFQAIGQYFCAFSKLDRELGETIKVLHCVFETMKRAT